MLYGRGLSIARSTLFLLVLLLRHEPSASNAPSGKSSDSTQEFVIGFVSTLITKYHLIAVAQAFMFDFQKNFDPSLVQRFGPPLVNYTNLNRSLRVRVVVAEAADLGLVAMTRAVDFVVGGGGWPKARALVMEASADVADGIAFMTSGARLLSVWQESESRVSDKSRYPYFFRMGFASLVYCDIAWLYVKLYGFRKAILFHSKEAYGEDMVTGLFQRFESGGRAHSLDTVAVQVTYDKLALDTAFQEIRQLRTKLLILALNRDCLVHTQNGLFDAGIAGPTYQIFGTFTSVFAVPSFVRLGGPYMSSHVMYTFPTETDPTVGLWDMLHNMTANDVDVQSLGLDLWSPSANFTPSRLVEPFLPESFTAQHPTQTRWDDSIAAPAYSVFMALAFVTQAANIMMNSGISISEASGEQLLTAARKASADTLVVPGANVQFDKNQDSLWTFYLLRFTPEADAFAIWMVLPGGIAASGSLFTIPGKNITWADGSQLPVAPRTLGGCQAGQYLEESTGRCVDCLRGTYTDSVDQTICKACPSTLIVNADNTGCETCPIGTLAGPGPSGDMVCQKCPPGQYIASMQNEHTLDAAKQECLACPRGKFADGSANTTQACTDCPERTTTAVVGAKSLRECVCASGSFHRCEGSQCDRGAADPSAAGFCEACPPGATCEGPPDSPTAMITSNGGHRPPYVPSGFMSVDTSVYRCGADGKACPGAFMFAPSSEMCADEGVGIACASCPKGRYWKTSSCQECGNGTLLVIMFIIVACCGSGVFIYHWNQKARKLDALESVLASVSIGVCVSFMQSLGVFSRMDYDWPSETKVVFDVVNLLLFDLAILQVGCVSVDTLAVRAVTSLLMPLLIVVLFFSWYPISRGINKLFSSFHAFQMDAIINAAGMVFQALFIAMVLSVAKGFDCYSSPNGKLTLRSSPADICWTGQHIPLVICSSIAGLVYVVGFSSLFAWVIYRAPVMVVHRFFRIRYRFVFFKYSPTSWYFGLVLMLRSVLISMVTIVSPNDGYVQFLLMLFILVMFGFCHLSCCPYASVHANRMETGILTFLIFILGIGSWFLADENGHSNADDYPDKAQELSTAILILLIMCFVMAVTVFAHALFEAAYPAKVQKALRAKLEPMIQNIRAAGLILQAIDNEHLTDILQHATYMDINSFVHVVDYLTVEVTGHQPEKSSRYRLPRVATEMKKSGRDPFDNLLESAAKLQGDENETEALRDFIRTPSEQRRKSNDDIFKQTLGMPSGTPLGKGVLGEPRDESQETAVPSRENTMLTSKESTKDVADAPTIPVIPENLSVIEKNGKRTLWL